MFNNTFTKVQVLKFSKVVLVSIACIILLSNSTLNLSDSAKYEFEPQTASFSTLPIALIKFLSEFEFGSYNSFVKSKESSGAIRVATYAPEICNNGIDDDGDGLIDCEDCADCATSNLCSDVDGDGIGDFCDLDDDNDGIPDTDECPPFTYGPELIMNGDFEDGYAHWTSFFNRGRNNFAGSNDGCPAQGWVAVSSCASINGACNNYYFYTGSTPTGTTLITDPIGTGANIIYNTNCNSSNDQCLPSILPDHTSGSGYSLYVDPSNVVGRAYWTQTVNVAQYTNYEFSAWLMVIEEDPNLIFKVNGANLSEPFNLDRQTGGSNGSDTWQQFNVQWYSGSLSGPITIELVNYTAGCFGNDIRIDDISFRSRSIGCDADQDGIINALDIDSDNDGIYDLVEAGHTASDTNNDGVIDGNSSSFGTNGLSNSVETSPNSGNLNYTIKDSESVGDGVYDAYELDADGDSCFDTEEALISDTDNDGIAGSGAPSVNIKGKVYGSSYADPTNTNWQNNSIRPCVVPEICNNGIDDDGDGLVDCMDCEDCASSSSCADNDNDGVGDFCDLDDDNDGIPDVDEGANWSTSGVLSFESDAIYAGTPPGPGTPPVLRTAVDGVSQYLDGSNNAVALNFEGWDRPGNTSVDWTEGQYILQSNWQAHLNHPAMIAPSPAGGAFAIFSTSGEALSRNIEVIPGVEYTVKLWFGVLPNYHTNNKDVDGTPGIDPDAGALFNYGGNIEIGAVSGADVAPGYTSPGTQIDPSGSPSSIYPYYSYNILTDLPTSYTAADFPSSLPPYEPSGVYSSYPTLDPHWMQIEVTFLATATTATIQLKTDNGAWSVFTLDELEIEYDFNAYDTDGDGVANYLDLDSDNDGIFDLVEAGHGAVDGNGDGIIDGAPSAFSSNGLFDGVETTTDNGKLNYSIANSEPTPDGIYDAYEIDSDDDGCPDVLEAGYSDDDYDGELGNSNVSVNSDGVVTSGSNGYTGTTSYVTNPARQAGCPDNDNDFISDGNDDDDDNDGITDFTEFDCSSAWLAFNLTWSQNNAANDAIQIQRPSVIASGQPFTYGSGHSGVSTNRRVDIPTITSKTLAEAILNSEYIEYEFTTQNLTSAVVMGEMSHNKNPSSSGATGNSYGYNVGISISKDGFTTQQMLSYGYYIDETIPSGWDHDYMLGDNEDYQLEPSQTYTVRVYFFNKKTPGTARFDDFALLSYHCANSLDQDGDNTFNHKDLDSDGDLCFDVKEAGFTDGDNDGILGNSPVSVENSGRVNPRPNGYSNPTQTVSGTPDYLSSATNIACQEVCNNGIDDDGDGLVDCADEDCLDCTPLCGDADGDGIGDTCDLDDDNDGIPDTEEQCIANHLIAYDRAYSGENINGNLNVSFSALSGLTGTVETSYASGGNVPIHPIYNDATIGLGITTRGGPSTTTGARTEIVFGNPVTIEEFIVTSIAKDYSGSYDESQQIRFYHNGTQVQFTPVISGTNGNPIVNATYNPLTGVALGEDPTVPGTGGEAALNFSINKGVDSIVVMQNTGANADNIGIRFFGICSERDSDNDGVPNHLDLDSDNDGIYDLVEAGHTAIDANNDGIIDGAPVVFGTNGLYDGIETVADNGSLAYTLSDSESTPDGLYDAFEIDADGDGCFDTLEEAVADAEEDGIAGTGTPSVSPFNGLVSGATYSVPGRNQWQNPAIGICLTEDCNNGIDDDGDGLVDCADEDCPTANTAVRINRN